MAAALIRIRYANDPKVREAFSEVPRKNVTKEMERAVERRVEFLLMYRLFKADHHNYEVPGIRRVEAV